MEQKLVRVPFNVESAKKITSGEMKGRIVTRKGYPAKILTFDMANRDYPICAKVLISVDEDCYHFAANGAHYKEFNPESNVDLMMEIPEYMTFKDGDILICECGTPFIYKDTKDRHGNFSAYCGIDLQGNIFFDMKGWTYSIKGHANEEQKKNIIKALKEREEPKAKEYLKRFFGIEEKKEYKFKPFDKVLVKDDDENSAWSCNLFSGKNEDGTYMCIGGYWDMCIPYNEETAHLLGTTEDFKL